MFRIFSRISKFCDIECNVKGHFNLFCNHCLIRLQISSEYNDFGFKGNRKNRFIRFSHGNALGNKFDLDDK